MWQSETRMIMKRTGQATALGLATGAAVATGGAIPGLASVAKATATAAASSAAAASTAASAAAPVATAAATKLSTFSIQAIGLGLEYLIDDAAVGHGAVIAADTAWRGVGLGTGTDVKYVAECWTASKKFFENDLDLPKVLEIMSNPAVLAVISSITAAFGFMGYFDSRADEKKKTEALLRYYNGEKKVTFHGDPYRLLKETAVKQKELLEIFDAKKPITTCSYIKKQYITQTT